MKIGKNVGEEQSGAKEVCEGEGERLVSAIIKKTRFRKIKLYTKNIIREDNQKINSDLGIYIAFTQVIKKIKQVYALQRLIDIFKFCITLLA